jgi:hypothetical protein
MVLREALVVARQGLDQAKGKLVAQEILQQLHLFKVTLAEIAGPKTEAREQVVVVVPVKQVNQVQQLVLLAVAAMVLQIQ